MLCWSGSSSRPTGVTREGLPKPGGSNGFTTAIKSQVSKNLANQFRKKGSSLDVVDSKLLLVADILLLEASDTLKLSDEAKGAVNKRLLFLLI